MIGKMLYLIGMGLSEQGISLEGLEAAKGCQRIYVETYTCKVDLKAVEGILGKKVGEADREFVESGKILEEAMREEIALVVGGDVFAATTHHDLVLRAVKRGIEFKVFHSASIISAVSECGLQSYKFGKITSIPKYEEGYEPESFFDVLEENMKINAHTLFLLGLDVSVKEAIECLLRIARKRGKGKSKKEVIDDSTLGVVCFNLGRKDGLIKAGKLKVLKGLRWKEGMFCLIVPSELHFMEKVFLERFM